MKPLQRQWRGASPVLVSLQQHPAAVRQLQTAASVFLLSLQQNFARVREQQVCTLICLGVLSYSQTGSSNICNQPRPDAISGRYGDSAKWQGRSHMWPTGCITAHSSKVGRLKRTHISSQRGAGGERGGGREVGGCRGGRSSRLLFRNSTTIHKGKCH